MVVLVTIDTLRQAARLFEQFITDGLRRLDQSRPLTVLARRAQCPFERLLHAFSCHDHKNEIVELQNLRRRLVVAQRILKSLHHLLTIATLLHVDQVEHDDPTEIS